MKLIKNNPLTWEFFVFALTFFTAFIYTFSGGKLSSDDGYFYFNDPFHQGEYFAAGKSIAALSSSAQPITIHGALDFIPDLITSSIFGDERQFLATYGLYALLGLSAVILLSVAHMSASTSAKQRWTVLGLSLTGVFTVGYRDLFLLLSLVIFYGLLIFNLTSAWRVLLLIVFGIILGLGQYWSFDRGIVATISLGAATLYLAWNDRRYIIALVSYAITLLTLNYLNDIYSLNTLFENIFVLFETSKQWRYENNPVTLMAFAWLINLLALAAFWISHFFGKTIKKYAGEAIALTLMAALMLKSGTNRADVPHVINALWIPGLLALRMNQTSFSGRNLVVLASWVVFAFSIYVGWRHKSFFPPLVSIIIAYEISRSQVKLLQRLTMVGICSVLFFVSLLILKNGYSVVKNNKFSWVMALPVSQSNWQTAQPSMQWIASELLKTQSPCVFDLSNNGIINGLTKLPSCSRFTYPVYATLPYEAELVQSLEQANPPVVVYWSTFWSYSIDGRSMKDRFPSLDKFILQRYPIEKCDYGYCVRYQTGIR